MSTSNVKAHIRTTASGRLAQVKQHDRSVEGKRMSAESFERKKAAKKRSENKAKDALLSAMEAKAKKVLGKGADAFLEKYKDRPYNMKLALDSKWKKVWVTKHRKKKDGGYEPYKVQATVWNVDEGEWRRFLKENSGLVGAIINKVNFRSDIIDDLKQAGLAALYEAANNYADKYNPQNPPDIMSHLSSQVAGRVKQEANKHTLAKLNLPHQKRVLFNKFTQIWGEMDGDWDKIHEHMKIRKKDLYPNITEGKDELIPQEGYTTSTKRSVLEKSTNAYEKSVNLINKKFEQDMAQLELRGGEEEMASFKDGLKEFDELKKKAKNRKEKADVEARRRQYELAFKPLSEEELELEKKRITDNKQIALKRAKAAYDAATERTTIQGTNELFRMFEGVMELSTINLSGTVESDEGVKNNIEEMLDAGTSITPEQEITIKADFKAKFDELNRAIDILSPVTQDMVRMWLGLHERNELYPHGLWGVPMTVTEISNNLPKDYFVKYEMSPKEYKESLAKWKEAKPTTYGKIKKDAATLSKETKMWEKRRLKAMKEIAKKITGSNLSPTQKQKGREVIYKKHKAGMVHKPTAFEKKRLSEREYQRQLRNWKNNKPKKGKVQYGTEELRVRINDEIRTGKRVLRRMFYGNTNFGDELIGAYRKMRKYGLNKGSVAEDLAKSLQFDAFFGIEYKKFSLAEKAYDKIVGFVKGIFG